MYPHLRPPYQSLFLSLHPSPAHTRSEMPHSRISDARIQHEAQTNGGEKKKACHKRFRALAKTRKCKKKIKPCVKAADPCRKGPLCGEFGMGSRSADRWSWRFFCFVTWLLHGISRYKYVEELCIDYFSLHSQLCNKSLFKISSSHYPFHYPPS